MRALLISGRPVDGVVAANTPMAVGALRALTDLGRLVPDDVGLICCESVPSAEFVAPSLTTIGCDLNLFGRAAARAVVDAIETGESRDGVQLPYQLTPRESTNRMARDA